MRNLAGKFSEIDLTQASAREKMRSAAILGTDVFDELWKSAPSNAKDPLRSEEESDELAGASAEGNDSDND